MRRDQGIQVGDKKRRQKIESSNFFQNGEKIIVTWNSQSEQEMEARISYCFERQKNNNTRASQDALGKFETNRSRYTT